ncbi:NAD(P)-dependent dehydrogenase (short-subunit alcohol dehydrogenase family) [Caulobacter ginsengisoli]|uniref:NAD(P)-dependent dehydrogenase (Short-subunit alcohol dehydrogenase family) n=1 Tax=Caulobacter ginsengisoli TaxID=400775 RepID=A0ABU0INY0_9CAUL|nr:glucose 1-dehydrogenase [Caulobacter ginsengisoli]MDQ0463718.1 NAD(P)-dependent dehydrogenase (short-subunit alcohol dehydrogenase family) [Caulobacter ginsengisoli]
MSGELRGRTAIITGAAGGIGAVSARLFAEAGANVVCADLSLEGAQAVAAGLPSALAVRVDVADSASVAAMVAAAVERFGRLDCAFNNAGIEVEARPTHEADEDVFDRTIAVNLRGVFLCLKHEIAAMLKTGGGSIVNTASIAGVGGAPNMPAYAASKHGVIGLTRTAALEYARLGIRVNAVCPGVVRTAMMKAAIAAAPARADRVAGMHPMNRVAEPEEVARAALWLCSDAASFITGDALRVDGGVGAR